METNETNKTEIKKEIKPEIKQESNQGVKKTVKKISKADFIEIDYTGKTKDDNIIFDTTDKAVAQKNNLNPNADYKPIIICVGEGYILPALEVGLIGKSLGKHSFDVASENAFGRKSAKLLKLVPLKVFKKQDIMPYPGLEVNVDGQFGIIRNVSGGRTIVDFNHPLSSKDLSYDINVKRIVTDDKEKLESIMKIAGIHYDSVSVKDKKAMIVLEHDVPQELKNLFESNAKEKIGLKTFDYVVKKKQPAKQ